MFETFGTMAGVQDALGHLAEDNGTCVRCHRGNRKVYPWPAPGLGMRCAACIVVESQENDA